MNEWLIKCLIKRILKTLLRGSRTDNVATILKKSGEQVKNAVRQRQRCQSKNRHLKRPTLDQKQTGSLIQMKGKHLLTQTEQTRTD